MKMGRRIGNKQKVEHPSNKILFVKMDEMVLETNTQIVGSHNKIFTAQESIIHGQPLILNVCNSFK
jgi:hypothetical protein